MNKNNYAVIMAGGIGSRFWPISRTDYPKQFLDILGIGKSLIQLTYERFLSICPKENIFVVAAESYREIIQRQLPDLQDNQILGEPARKNTAPCIAYASYKIHFLNPNANIVVAPSDHIILKEALFTDAVGKGLDFVSRKECLITLGIRPTRPDTGYGYIQYREEKEENGIHKVKTFTEKPTLEIAKSFLESGDFLWNSGIFIWNVKTIIQAFKRLLPEMHDAFSDIRKSFNTDAEKEEAAKAYSLCPNLSIDYGVLEKADNVWVIPGSFDWSDLGTWASLYEKHKKDENGNAISGKNVMTYQVTNCMIMAPDEKLIVLQNLNDFIIIDSPDVLLVCPKSKEQEIKQITQDVKRKKDGRFL